MGFEQLAQYKVHIIVAVLLLSLVIWLIVEYGVKERNTNEKNVLVTNPTATLQYLRLTDRGRDNTAHVPNEYRTGDMRSRMLAGGVDQSIADNTEEYQRLLFSQGVAGQVSSEYLSDAAKSDAGLLAAQISAY